MGKLLGAESAAKKAYASMLDASAIKIPLSWTSPDFQL